jgi:hypothetical protein
MSRVIAFFVLVLVFNLSTSFVPIKKLDKQENLCGLEVADAYTQEVLGKNIGFYVKFYNNSSKTIDAIEYKVIFKNGFNEIKGSKGFTWQAGNLVGPMKPKSYLSDGSTNWIDNANKLEVKIIRIHFTDDTTCEDNSSIKTL